MGVRPGRPPDTIVCERVDVTEVPVLRFPDVAAWSAWLDAEHRSADGIWLQLAKKGSTRAEAAASSLTYDEALEVALCYGWIDGQKKPLDDGWWLQRFTPRRRASRWSQRNRRAAEGLIAAGRMMPAGLAEVERARLDGRWDAAYAGASTIQVPPDLTAALAEDPAAAAAFEGLDGTNRYAILYRLQDAKKPETRARRLATFVEMLREGRTLHPRRGEQRRS
jgi:uncharacterized protein YdeI (YjbR/CyaY-like superfamily)